MRLENVEHQGENKAGLCDKYLFLLGVSFQRLD
jgi:hypothetical protein